MNQIAYYPRDSITFAEPPREIQTPVKSWRKATPSDPEIVSEGNSDADWAAWDEAVATCIS